MLDQEISPMLAYSAEPFDSADHLYEIKWDGTRCILFIESHHVRLQNRRLADITYRYPELWDVHRGVKDKNLVLDGELVILEEGKSNFGKLQQREHITDPLKIRLLSRRMPATYVMFDVLYRNHMRCTKEPLQYRKEMLSELIGHRIAGLLESQFVREHGIRFFREVVAKGFEGVMAKSLTSPYLIGKRSRHWLKIKPRGSAVCSIVGYTPGKGSRERFFGALAVAERKNKNWIYRGKVGSGFTDDDIRQLHPRLKQLRADRPPASHLRRLKGIQWVKPELQCRLIFQEYSSRGHFRAPVFDGLRQ
jgi:DNA ligase D-like protein (predicted ligase)